MTSDRTVGERASADRRRESHPAGWSTWRERAGDPRREGHDDGLSLPGLVIAAGTFTALRGVLEDWLEWEGENDVAHHLAPPLGRGRALEVLDRLLACVPHGGGGHAFRSAVVVLAEPLALSGTDLAVLHSVPGALLSVSADPFLGEFLDRHAQVYFSAGLSCLHGEDERPPAIYRSRFVDEVSTAVWLLSRAGVGRGKTPA